MIRRPVLGTVLLAALVVVGGLGAVSIVSHDVKLRRQAAVDEQVNERIVEELGPLIEAELRSMGAERFVSSHCGAFQSLDEARLTRLGFPTGAGRIVLLPTSQGSPRSCRSDACHEHGRRIAVSTGAGQPRERGTQLS